MTEFNFLQHLPAIIPEAGLTLLAIIVLFVDVYGGESQKRNIAYISAIGMALLAITPLIWSPAFYDGETIVLWGGMIKV